MTTENLVTIDFDSEIVNNNNEIDVIVKSQNNSHYNQEIDLIPDVSFNDQHQHMLDDDRIVGESQPLLGDHHDHITYNQFPGKNKSKSSDVGHQ
jgi:hypothetical protein